ncbi:MAG: non-hydrolyzing UDP-N-acetylglucosamine 2-epimerase [Solirubrobacteraceae bacterium]
MSRAVEHVTAVVAARPNFVKMAPVVAALADGLGIAVRVVHTGQHYDPALSDSFLEQLGMPRPDLNLEVGSATHAEQTARVMVGIERALKERPTQALVVAGDVNSTMAAALAAAKLGVPIVHVESGLRSGDWTMPEEINRVVTDRVSDLLLCTCDDAVDNLAAEAIVGDGVALVGNTMIDSLRRLLDAAQAAAPLAMHRLQPGEYVLVTLHRPALVDDPAALLSVLEALDEIAARLPVVFPIHPRTRARLERAGAPTTRVALLEPLSYLEFLGLEASARLVITDSGGVQEETSALGVPCLTYRTTTERPVTITLGTNRLVGTDPEALLAACRKAMASSPSGSPAPIPLWDGAAGPRAAAAISSLLAEPRGRSTGQPPDGSGVGRRTRHI